MIPCDCAQSSARRRARYPARGQRRTGSVKVWPKDTAGLGNDARGGIAQGLSRFVFVKQYDLRVQFTHSSVKICTDVSPSNCGSFTAITSEREVGMFLPT